MSTAGGISREQTLLPDSGVGSLKDKGRTSRKPFLKDWNSDMQRIVSEVPPAEPCDHEKPSRHFGYNRLN